jgi:hypothetical protein
LQRISWFAANCGVLRRIVANCGVCGELRRVAANWPLQSRLSDAAVSPGAVSVSDMTLSLHLIQQIEHLTIENENLPRDLATRWPIRNVRTDFCAQSKMMSFLNYECLHSQLHTRNIPTIFLSCINNSILRHFAVNRGKSRQIVAFCGVFVANCCEVGLGLGPLSVWMKMEECTLFVGCTSNFIAADKDDNHIDATDGDVTDESDTTNCVDLDGKHSMNILYRTCIKCVVRKINIISTNNPQQAAQTYA